jgi:hypothetical protein
MVCFGAVLFEGAFALKNEEAIVKRAGRHERVT